MWGNSYFRAFYSESYPKMALTNTAIQNAKNAEKPYKLYDTDGLFMQVTPAGGTKIDQNLFVSSIIPLERWHCD